MSKLFESSSINGMQLANRFVRSATWEGMAGNSGEVTPQLIETITTLARGGVGLIVSSHAYVRPEGQATPHQLGVYGDELIPGLGKLSRAVHEQGGSIVLQLAHAGCLAAGKLTGRSAAVVSDIEGLAAIERKELTVEDIRELVEAYAAAAFRASLAGFDGVQLHSAHGYLLSQFLSPLFNKRRDEYGGSVRNRARIHLEICSAIRKAAGPDFPVMIKMNCRDFKEGGLSLDDSVLIAALLAEGGFDAIELSGGLLPAALGVTGKIDTRDNSSPHRPGINSPEKEAYFEQEARAFRHCTAPLILVGGIRSFEVAERIVEGGTADYISMSRPFIREPDLINRWKSGDRRKAECKSDNLCFKPGFEGEWVYCVAAKLEKAG